MKGLALGVLVAIGISPVATFARETDWGVGFNVNTPYFLSPVKEPGDTSINLQGEWTPRRWISVLGETEFAVQGFHEVILGAGPRIYGFTDYRIRPFLEVGGLLQLNPRTDGGIRGGAGVNFDMKWLFGVDRLWLTLRWDVSMLFRSPRTLFFDLYRLGLTAYY